MVMKMEEDKQIVFRTRLRRIMNKQSLRQEAARIGISHSTLSRLESYKFRPRLDTLEKLHKALENEQAHCGNAKTDSTV